MAIGYDRQAKELLFSEGSGQVVGRRAIKGINAKELMGEFEPYVGTVCFQPELPLSFTGQGVIRLCETMVA